MRFPSIVCGSGVSFHHVECFLKLNRLTVSQHGEKKESKVSCFGAINPHMEDQNRSAHVSQVPEASGLSPGLDTHEMGMSIQ